jgi:hypothetical protein
LWPRRPASFAAARRPIRAICAFAQSRAPGRKVGDEFTVTICRVHHDELHKRGDEAAWCRSVNIDPAPIALELWRRTRPDRASDSSPGTARPEAATSADIAEPGQPGVWPVAL